MLCPMEHGDQYRPESWISDKTEEENPLWAKFKESPGGQPSQLQAIRQRNLNDIAERGEDMSEERKSASSKIDFIGLAGIGPELAEFVIEFLEKPEIFFSMSFERRYEIESQMDAILSSVGGDWGWRSE